MLKWAWLGVVAIFLIALIWMINDVRLELKATTAALRAGPDGTLSRIEKTVEVTHEHLPAILEMTHVHLPDVLQNSREGSGFGRRAGRANRGTCRLH